MKKVLFVATITGHIKSFHIPYLKWFKEQGYEVKPEYIAYMWNAGVYSDIINIGIWATNYPYLSRFEKAYQEVEDALNLLLK